MNPAAGQSCIHTMCVHDSQSVAIKEEEWCWQALAEEYLQFRLVEVQPIA